MSRSTRLFEIIQILRSAQKPMTAGQLAETLEVSTRTIYRDIAVLQSMRTPIEGEAGIGYVMRSGYDLPPLNFTIEEIEALYVGLGLLARTGDPGMRLAANQISKKIDALWQGMDSLNVSEWGVVESEIVSATDLRRAIRKEQKVKLSYCDGSFTKSIRIVLPIALTYYVEVIVLICWCELRHDFRHFRLGRIESCTYLADYFENQGNALRKKYEIYKNSSPS